MITASVLDYPRENLDPQVWDLQEFPPTLHTHVAKLIDTVANKVCSLSGVKPDAVTARLLVGSIATLQWIPESDIDVHLIVNLPPDAQEEAEDVAKALEDEWALGKHPIHVYLLSATGTDKLLARYDNVYDLDAKSWIRLELDPEAIDPEVEERRILEQALAWAHKIDMDLGDANREFVEHEYLRRSLRMARPETVERIKLRLQESQSDLEQDIETLVKDYDTLKLARKEAFAEALDGCQDHECARALAKGSLNLLDENLVVKLLERWGTWHTLKTIAHAWKEAEQNAAHGLIALNADRRMVLGTVSSCCV